LETLMAVLRSGSKPMVTRRGAAMLAASSCVGPPTGQPPLPADVTAAREFVAPLVFGLNVDRWRVVTMAWTGKPLRSDTAYWIYLKSLGVTHIRMFLPWRTTTDVRGVGWTNGVQPTDADLGLFLDAAETIIRAGLKVLYECTDYLGTDLVTHRAAIEQVIARQADMIKARGTTRFPQTMIAIGPFAGLEFDGNADANPYRLAAHKILRERLPGYVLLTGAANRSSPVSLAEPDWFMVSDYRTILTVHEYAGVPLPTYLQGQVARYDAVSAANGGVPVICTECAHGSAAYQTAWLDHIDAYATYQPLIRPTFWVVTDGGSYNFGTSNTDLTIRAAIVQKLDLAWAKIQNDAGWKAQNPGVTPHPFPQPPPTTTLTDVQFAQNWVAPLTVGIVVDRLYINHCRAYLPNRGFFTYLKSLGLTHVRLILPWRPNESLFGLPNNWVGNTTPPANSIDSMLDNCLEANAVGLKTFCNFMDEVYYEFALPHWDAIKRYATLIGQRIALKNFDATMACFNAGPTEWIGGIDDGRRFGRNTEMNPLRMDLHNLMRAQLPQFVLTSASSDWGSPRSLVHPDWQAPSDKRCIATWHQYNQPWPWGDPNQQNIAEYNAEQRALEEFSTRHGGIPTVCQEWGLGGRFEGPEWIRRLQTLRDSNLIKQKAMPWAISAGAWLRMNIDETNVRLKPHLATVLGEINAAARARPDWNPIP
jgi:hypothetical protein